MRGLGIHPIRTGTAAVKVPFMTRHGGPVASRLRIFTSKAFTPPFPILSWLIEHDEGDILIDAGMSESCLAPDYLRSLGRVDAWVATHLCRFDMAPGDGLGPQLRRIRPRGTDGLRVAMTHLHLDHIGGLSDLPGVPVLVNRAEWQRPFGAPKPLLAAMTPDCFEFKATDTVPGFDAWYPLTREGDLFAIPAPGHTKNHCAIVLKRAGVTVLFAGDAVYDQGQLSRLEIAGAHVSARLALDTMQRMHRFIQAEPTVVLPSHDADAERRLNAAETFRH